MSRLPAGYPLKGCRIGSNVRRIARVYGREQASRAYITGGSMEEDDMVKSRVGNTPSTERETNRWGRKGCKPKGL